MSINNQPIPFPIDRDSQDFHALFQYMFYTWVQNRTHIETFFNKILNVMFIESFFNKILSVKHG